MPKKKIGLFPKIIIVLFAITVLSCIIGRDHFILGTALISGRWLFFITGLAFMYFATKHINSTKHLVILSIPIMFLLLEFVWIQVNRGSLNETPTGDQVSLMTYNLFFKNKTPNASFQKILEAKPDILALQELTPQLESLLLKSVQHRYPYKKTLALRGTHGIGIYSKYPIQKCTFMKNESQLPYAQIVEIKVNSKLIQVINVHLSSPAIAVENPDNFLPLLASNYELRASQLGEIQTAVNSDGFDAQVLMGDLNTTSYEPLFRSLSNRWVNLFDIAGNGSRLNFPHSSKFNPILTLDYIMIRGNIKGFDANVIMGGGSDHLAIFGKIGI